MMNPTSFELYIQWLQIFLSLAFPIVVGALLLLAWLDFHRWVNHQIERDDEEERLAGEVKEFIE